jgi:hypothetical protein
MRPPAQFIEELRGLRDWYRDALAHSDRGDAPIEPGAKAQLKEEAEAVARLLHLLENYKPLDP